MKVRDAAVRAIRSLIQGAVAALVVFAGALASHGSFAGVRGDFDILVFGLALAGLHALITFGQNLTEDNTNVSVPKG